VLGEDVTYVHDPRYASCAIADGHRRIKSRCQDTHGKNSIFIGSPSTVGAKIRTLSRTTSNIQSRHVSTKLDAVPCVSLTFGCKNERRERK
jgi:hypothetical protein